ncbi:DUF2849 domain-containing protein [Lentibacter algarum]|uniref:DUF2849 domain-containing protein n=1 Tax=Lentibacter algarum TaxID=576131 RepID=UPI001C06EA3D|nr:DUF2849 domain-containing protein [Lentibacter algarum]MBU2981715.1 DUF2849 domain-containing protein [Lentibacter algarum]
MSHQVITANALLEGDVVYLSKTNHWVRRLEDAEVFADAELAKLALELAEVRDSEVVGVYLMNVSVETGTPAPTHFREAFRQTGPSNRFHGKQEQTHVSV